MLHGSLRRCHKLCPSRTDLQAVSDPDGELGDIATKLDTKIIAAKPQVCSVCAVSVSDSNLLGQPWAPVGQRSGLNRWPQQQRHVACSLICTLHPPAQLVYALLTLQLPFKLIQKCPVTQNCKTDPI